MIVRAVGMLTWWEIVLAWVIGVLFVVAFFRAASERREQDYEAWLRVQRRAER